MTQKMQTLKIIAKSQNFITQEDAQAIIAAANEKGLPLQKILSAYQIKAIEHLPLLKFADVMDRINKFQAVN
jgi:hypothetical protein